MPEKKKLPTCALCGGKCRPIAGLLTCEKCGHRQRTDFGNTGPGMKSKMSRPAQEDEW